MTLKELEGIINDYRFNPTKAKKQEYNLAKKEKQKIVDNYQKRIDENKRTISNT